MAGFCPDCGNTACICDAGAVSKAIETLTKTELLDIIYHYLPETKFRVQPCHCVVCAGRTFKNSYGYICDACNNDLK